MARPALPDLRGGQGTQGQLAVRPLRHGQGCSDLHWTEQAHALGTTGGPSLGNWLAPDTACLRA
eukprot:1557816-Lingulodinium_polyedra.AAC.1